MDMEWKRGGNEMEQRERLGTVWKVRIAITSKHVNGRRPRDQMWKHVKNIGIRENGRGGKHMEMSEIMVRKSARDIVTSTLRIPYPHLG